MELAKIIGTIWATQKDKNLEGLKMQIIQPIDVHKSEKGSPIIAVDTVGAGVDEIVYYVTAYEAVIPLEKKPALADAAIVGIVDKIEIKEKLL